MTVGVLLSVWNGRKYLQQQLDSIGNQTYADWHLFVRDDNSSDNSLTLIKAFSARYPGKVTILEDKLGNLGAMESFFELLSRASTEYFAFCDQDDVWNNDKIEISMTALLDEEARSSSSMPLLVHSDLEVVDEHLNRVSPSFMSFQSLDAHSGTDPRKLVARNVVTGCTMVFNKALKKRVFPVPPGAGLHDWWVAVCAAMFGKVMYIDKALIKYRQHSSNTVGAKGASLAIYAKLFLAGGARKMVLKAMHLHAGFAGSLLSRFESDLRPEMAAYLRAFQKLPDYGPIKRRFEILRNRLWLPGLANSVAWILFC